MQLRDDVVYIVGDTHGTAYSTDVLVATLPRDSHVISVGDWGFPDSVTRELPLNIMIAHGNKEKWLSCDMSGQSFFKNSGHVENVNGIDVGFVPGAASPNGVIAHPRRRKNEMPRFAVWSSTPDIIVSHDCPAGAVLEQYDRYVVPYDRRRVKASRNIVKNMILSAPGTVQHVFHGHYHRSVGYTWNGIHATCLSCVGDPGSIVACYKNNGVVHVENVI